VTFDPFGDFATEGYLRNFEKEKDLAIVKRAENASFTTGLDEAFGHLAGSEVLSYNDVLKTHDILFGAVYPWAGQDRTQTAKTDHQEGHGHFCERTGNPRCGRVRPAQRAGQALHES
jgi:fido (protein-threonine AMPylation protein)